MTLDEARAHLGVTSAATVDEIREAFRRRARALHPDLHPDADSEHRARLGRDFHNVREARDILVRHISDPLRKSAPDRSESEPPRHSAPPQGTRPSANQTPRPERPPRVTMRFDEFVAWSDAAGFGTGFRSPRSVDWARIIVWSSLGILIVGLVTTGIVLANVV